MIKRFYTTFVAIALLGGCSAVPQYIPDNSLMGKHIVAHGNTSPTTALSERIYTSTRENFSNTPAAVSQYGSTTHIAVHMRNITQGGAFDENFHEILHELKGITKMYPDIAIDVRYGLDPKQGRKFTGEIEDHIRGNVRSLTFTSFLSRDQRNVRKPFTTNPSLVTFIIYPTKLPAPQ